MIKRYTTLRELEKSLLTSKPAGTPEFQKASFARTKFLSGALNSILKGREPFAKWFEQELAEASGNHAAIVTGEAEVSSPNKQLELGEFMRPSPSTMVELYSAIWKNEINREDARDPGVWARIYIKMVIDGAVSPSFAFAPTNSSGAPDGTDLGMKKIQEAVQSKAPAKTDEVCRDFIRHISGVQTIRGLARSLFSNCCLASMYWRCKVAEETEDPDWSNSIMRVLSNSAIWNELIAKLVSNLTVLGDRNIKNATLLFLASSDGSTYKRQKDLHKLLMKIGAMAGCRALGLLDVREIKNEIVDMKQNELAGSYGQ